MKLNKISLPVGNQHIKIEKPSIKEASPCIHMEASYMTEAVIAIPFFVGFMTILLFFFPVLTVQQEVGNALLVIGREMSVDYECVGDYEAKKLLLKHVKKKSVADLFIRGGRNGISLIQSEYEGEYIFLQADYQIPYPVGLFGKHSISITQKIKCRKWKGRDDSLIEPGQRIVYITHTGTVYHKSRDCTYLNPSVTCVNGSELPHLRNQSGEKYYECFSCMKNINVGKRMVYITKYGNRYHGKRDCKKIKRSIHAIRLSEVAGRSVCSKCGKE